MYIFDTHIWAWLMFWLADFSSWYWLITDITMLVYMFATLFYFLTLGRKRGLVYFVFIKSSENYNVSALMLFSTIQFIVKPLPSLHIFDISVSFKRLPSKRYMVYYIFKPIHLSSQHWSGANQNWQLAKMSCKISKYWDNGKNRILWIPLQNMATK